jgi:hypothetical protein
MVSYAVIVRHQCRNVSNTPSNPCPTPQKPPSPLFPLHTAIPSVSPLFPLDTKIRGWGPPSRSRRLLHSISRTVRFFSHPSLFQPFELCTVQTGRGVGSLMTFNLLLTTYLPILLMSARRHSCASVPLTPIIPAHAAIHPQVQSFPHLRKTGGRGYAQYDK